MKNDKGGHMKDLDLDELHAAVNKLMDEAQKPKAKRTAAKSAAKSVTRPSVKVAERPAPANDEKPAPKPAERPTAKPADDNDTTPVSVTVRTKPAANVLPKKRGMAMDVVQAPKPTTVAPPSARAARTAPTLQPTGAVTPEPPKPRETTEPTPAPQPALPAVEPQKPQADDVSEDMLSSLNMQTDGAAKPDLLSDDKPVASAFPDPLDVHGFTDTPDKKEEPAKDEPVAAPAPESPHVDPLLDDTDVQPKAQWDMPANDTPAEPAKPAEPEQPAPSVTPEPTPAPETPGTPFLNTKVEKRPLGGYGQPTPAPAATSPVVKKDDPIAPSAVGDTPAPAAVDVPAAPAELRPEIVAVESAENDYAKAAHATPHGAQHQDEPTDLRQMAIPQQHHGHEKAPDHNERPVFDTKNYHPPIQAGVAPKHHGSKAGTVFTVILIILLVAAGVGAYFVATGSIDLSSYL